MRLNSRLNLLGLTAVVALAGCSQQQQAAVENTAEQAGNTVERAAEQVENRARPAMTEARQEITDSGLTLKVKTALSASDQVSASGINVDTNNRVVYLKGRVPNAQQKKLAETIARNTVGAGVKVINQLQVQSPAGSTASDKKG